MARSFQVGIVELAEVIREGFPSEPGQFFRVLEFDAKAPPRLPRVLSQALSR